MRLMGLVVALVLTGAVVAPATGEATNRPPRRLSFGVATFNVLGSQFTRRPGGYFPGTVRARVDVRMIKHRHLALIGLQEVQVDQLAVLRRLLPGYQFWPSTTEGHHGEHLQIAVQRSTFAIVGHGELTTPFHGRHRPLPWLLVRHEPTGRMLYVVDLHNSSQGTPRGERERDNATKIEIALVQRLHRHHGVLLLGDANERREFFCKVVGQTTLRAAAGGFVSPQQCAPPAGHLPIDWIMGSGPFTFSRYRVDRDHKVKAASDHPLVHAVITMTPGRH